MNQTLADDEVSEDVNFAHLSRVVLVTFLLMFMAARAMVLLIMLKWVPTMYLHVKGTHVHHLNYGIILLAIVGGYLLFRRPRGRRLTAAAVAYGVGLALTFDEFGMWVHLGGPYWQRASFDAVIVVAAVLSLLAVAPAYRKFRSIHHTAAVVIAIVLIGFGVVLVKSLHRAHDRISPILQQIEDGGPQ